MPPVANSFTASQELNKSVAMNFVVPNLKGNPSAWSDTITTTIFVVAALITASISIWQAHRYLHGVAQLKQEQSEGLGKPTQIDDNSYRQSGLSRSKTNASTISGETIRTTLDEFYRLETQSPSRRPVEHETRKSEKRNPLMRLSESRAACEYTLVRGCSLSPITMALLVADHTTPPQFWPNFASCSST
ncbi:hypothetical protein BU16DRAFT_535227 [Lophium mytilinum]|uniref:Uncharacterized protein n=1 Tax=Lophium mytilinum TaxID=390894 RepID=A0A6A6RA90_9PEZI|nr:hypothetical protein BU16DRAFT_535227 [Lophium mytilinum]